MYDYAENSRALGLADMCKALRTGRAFRANYRQQHHVLEIVRARRLATVVVLHDLNLAARYCDRVLVLEDGRIRAEGPPADALEQGLIGATYAVAAERAIAADGAVQFLFRGRDAHGAPDCCGQGRC